ncbi:MAG: tetratricopeptide repeat protein [Thermoplasmata archaeon]
MSKQLKVKVRAAEAARLEGRSPVLPDSYLAYLRGRTLLHRGLPASFRAAKEQFELAISSDPNNAAAYSGLADVAHLMGMWSADVPQSVRDQTGRGLVGRAIELDPNLAEAHTSLGMFHWDGFEYNAAEKEFKLALSLNPSYSQAHLWYAGLLQDEGRVDEALVECALAEGTDPLSVVNLGVFARLLLWRGRYDEALTRIQKVGELDSFGLAYRDLMGDYYALRSDIEGCFRELNKFEELEVEPRIKLTYRAWYHAVLGEKDRARDDLRQLAELPGYSATDWTVANVHAELGDLDECFRLLEKSVENHLIYFQEWRLNPRLENVRRDPRFQRLLKKMNLA